MLRCTPPRPIVQASAAARKLWYWASFVGIVAAGLATFLIGPQAQAQEGATPPHWIWHPADPPNQAPAETRYFRKEFHVKEVSRLAIDVTADNDFTLYLDGEEILSGDNWRIAKTFTTSIPTGFHVLAAVASNEEPGPAGFLLRGGILPLGQGVPIHSDRRWQTTDQAPEGDAWLRPGFDGPGQGWVDAADLGVFGTAPWGRRVAFESGDASERFRVPEGFSISMVAAPSVTGSAIAFGFDPDGQPCVSVERGPIIRLVDSNGDGIYDDRVVIAPQMNNCQGFSFIKGALYAVGNGPDRTPGIYRLEDTSGDGVYDDKIELVRASDGGMAEHGPHAIRLGPDGLLYFNAGNHAHLQPPIAEASPVNVIYEGQLLPDYKDARGHAANIKAPGGEIYRSPDDGKTWERIVAGFRNQYDFGFNRAGEIFSFDSDMEWDIGLPWYRPVRVNFCPPGADFGWRTGSGKWPDYFADSLPGILDVGRGSPTGVTFYQGNAFPSEYDDAFLINDWSQGRILAVKLTQDGGGYKADASDLVTGQPLNCTGIEVGPDGAVYFTNGGRGTTGGLFRVAWNDAQPQPTPGDPIEEALTIASPLSSYSQARLRQIREQLGDEFGARLARVTIDRESSPARRIRAMDLLIQHAFEALPPLTIVGLSLDSEPAVRAHAVLLLGMHDDADCQDAILDALDDDDPFIRRRACEALVRGTGEIPIDRLLPVLATDDRWVRFAARNALEHAGPWEHRDEILAREDPWARIEGMLALVRVKEFDAETQNDLLKRQVALLKERLDRAQRLALLRLIGLTYIQGAQDSEAPASSEFRALFLTAYPSGDPATDRELARLLAYLGEPKAVPEILAHQAATEDQADQIHDTYCLRVLKNGWDSDSKQQLWAWYETASHWDGGFSFLGYLDFMAQELLALLTPEERGELLAEGASSPFPTRLLVRALDPNAEPAQIDDLAALYQALDPAINPGATNELRGLILEKLGQSRLPASNAALRSIAEGDPARRDVIARALAQNPKVEDLPLLVQALESRDPNTTNAVLGALERLDAKPEGPDGFRSLLRLARRTGPDILPRLNTLASRWIGSSAPNGEDFEATLSHWEQLYAERFPNGPSLADASAAEEREYTLDELLAEVLRPEARAQAVPERGHAVLVKARCLDCHTFGDDGAGLGPDLTTLSSRFDAKDILEAILLPSKEISDQYQSVTIATVDGRILNGMPAGGDDQNLILLLSDGTRTTILKDDIEEQAISDVSVMPEGLLNTLSIEEITDMIALFEAQPKVEVTEETGAGGQD